MTTKQERISKQWRRCGGQGKLSIREAAEKLGRTKGAVVKMIANGVLTAEPVGIVTNQHGTVWGVDRASLEQYIKNKPTRRAKRSPEKVSHDMTKAAQVRWEARNAELRALGVMSVTQAARELGLTRSRVHQLIQEGHIKAVKRNGRYEITPQVIEEYRTLYAVG